jgi:hypothetical protein
MISKSSPKNVDLKPENLSYIIYTWDLQETKGVKIDTVMLLPYLILFVYIGSTFKTPDFAPYFI